MSTTKLTSETLKQVQAMIDAGALAKACKVAGAEPVEFIVNATNSLARTVLEDEAVAQTVSEEVLTARKHAKSRKWRSPKIVK